MQQEKKPSEQLREHREEAKNHVLFLSIYLFFWDSDIPHLVVGNCSSESSQLVQVLARQLL